MSVRGDLDETAGGIVEFDTAPVRHSPDSDMPISWIGINGEGWARRNVVYAHAGHSLDDDVVDEHATGAVIAEVTEVKAHGIARGHGEKGTAPIVSV